MFGLLRAFTLAATALVSYVSSQDLPSSFPHVYPGQPSGDLGPNWQDYFEVTDTLPNVTFPLTRSFAGNIPVGRSGHPNDTLFFWAFEKQNGTLTSNQSTEPWGIWLNGGPGSSSMAGLLFENGPIRIGPDYGASANKFSWNTVADFFWIDQPVGVGFSTADSEGYVADEEQIGKDFMGFLANLVKVFPSLTNRPLYLSGESYAGTYIPYILKTYFGTSNPPVKIAKIAIGDGSVGSGQEFELLPAVSVIETYPQIIGYDVDVYKYFKQQSHLCGYDVNLTYPQNGIIPPIALNLPSARDVPFALQSRLRFASFQTFQTLALSRVMERSETEDLGALWDTSNEESLKKREEGKREWRERRLAERDLERRDLSNPNVLDPWYGCLLLDEFIDYAINFTFPWNISLTTGEFGFDVYDVQDALSPEAPMDASVWMNALFSLLLADNRTRTAIHAPTSKDWELTFDSPFGANGSFDPSPEPMTFLTDLATNATAHNVSVILYSGNDDTLIAHRGTEVVIQNTTFGGVQGFSRKPSTPWQDDSGNFAGIVHQERGWTYVLFKGAGHLVPAKNPANALVFVREFFIGENATGLVTTDSSGGQQVIGGEDAPLAGDILPGADEIFYGPGTTLSTFVFPEATRAAWTSFIEAQATGSVLSTDDNAAVGQSPPWGAVLGAGFICVSSTLLLLSSLL
ncbi:alpha/beta-hydrolase [Dendrothele bispora CBS 962.96]|uniref:Carboxypeptidase n=1 Tax=Dendrothele bispora (strain CBS 962.96) TaxID=1314807 RepID=A0A4S8MRW0_DENBC|nr:alpha/beta-hydrolase [Dendrothele bispora CBS 962.96]